MSHEHRRHARLHVQANVDLLGEEIVLHAPLADLSQGGCRIASPVGREPGDPFTLVLELAGPTDPGLVLPAELVRRTQTSSALRFGDLAPEQRRELRTHLHRLHGIAG